MRIYLDICCLNRPFDDQAQERVRLESEAVVVALASIQRREHTLVGSTILDFENSRSINGDRRKRIMRILTLANVYVEVGDKEIQRAAAVMAMGFGAHDAMHIACAEAAGAKFLVTTDDGMLARSVKMAKQLRVVICNPLTWIREKDNENTYTDNAQ